jgi:hypothetical protein
MSYGRAYVFSALAALTALAFPANGQSVIATRSGVVHFFEGAVYLNDKPLEPHLGRFPNMAEGAELRTAYGRAEVLLTPGVFLRVGEMSAIRMVANDLSDTRVELLAGSAIVDSVEPSPSTAVTLIYKDWKVRLLRKGVYRIDSEPPRLWVRQGEAEVSAGDSAEPVFVGQGMALPFAAVLVPEPSINGPGDTLSNWAKGRSESISADNAIIAQIETDPASRNSGLAVDSFTYFPLVGIPSLGLSSSPYNSFTPYQAGFNSIYLPGYTYRPFFVGLAPGGFRSYLYSPPRRVVVSPGTGRVVPTPHAPLPRPAPAPARPSPHVGARAGGRR